MKENGKEVICGCIIAVVFIIVFFGTLLIDSYMSRKLEIEKEKTKQLEIEKGVVIQND